MGVHCFAQSRPGCRAGASLPQYCPGGFEYIKNPPSVTFKAHGKLITVHSRKIAVNASKDEVEARKIVEWLRNEVNNAWENRTDMEPCTESSPPPQVIEVLKLLPKTNCRQCDEPSCMVFATRVVEGAKGLDACEPMESEQHQKLEHYMSGFNLID